MGSDDEKVSVFRPLMPEDTMASYLYVWFEVSLPLNETGLNHHWCQNKLFVYSKPLRSTLLAHLCWECWIPVTVKEASLLAMNRRRCHGDDAPGLLFSICGFSKLRPWWTFPLFSRSWRGNSRWILDDCKEVKYLQKIKFFTSFQKILITEWCYILWNHITKWISLWWRQKQTNSNKSIAYLKRQK